VSPSSRRSSGGDAALRRDDDQGISLGVLVYDRTGSPLFTALSMFGPSAAQLLGALTLLSFADRVRPRAALVMNRGQLRGGGAVVATPGLSITIILALVGASGLVSVKSQRRGSGDCSPRSLPPSRYLLGRSLFTMSNGIMQMLGFGVGAARRGDLTARDPAAGRAGTTGPRWPSPTWASRIARARGRAGLVRNHLDRQRTAVVRAVPAAAVRCDVGAERADRRLRGRCSSVRTTLSGLLFAASAAGMLAGDVLVGRF